MTQYTFNSENYHSCPLGELLIGLHTS